MEVATEQKIIQPTDQHDVDLNKAVGGIQPDAQKPIPLTEELRQIGVDVTHIAGSAFKEVMSGVGGSTRDRVASNNPISLVWERARRMKEKLIQEKAA